jgi:hypothetical protein
MHSENCHILQVKNAYANWRSAPSAILIPNSLNAFSAAVCTAGVILFYCYIVIILYCYIVVLLYCYIVILLYFYIFYCYIVTLLYFYIFIFLNCYIVIFLVKILGTFAKLQYSTISFVMSVRLSDCLGKLGYHLTDFHYILYFRIFENLYRKFQFH